MESVPIPGAEQLYDAAPCANLVAGPGGQLLHANQTLCRWLRYDRAELLGLRLSDLFTSGGRIFLHTHLQPLLRMQGSVAEVKLEVRRKDGRLLPMIFNMAEQGWQGVNLLHLAGFVVEDRHKYEKELLQQRQRAEELLAQHARDQQALAEARAQAEDRARFAEQLVGVVSHDIRNPLSVIHMSSVLLERGGLSEQQRAVVARIERGVARMQHLVGDLLDFSQARLGSGLRITRRGVDLHTAIAEAVAELALAFPARRIEHRRSGPGHCNADAERIVQAVGNLVANAASHGAPDQPITVESAGDARGFTVSVHNFGNPIPATLVPALFEPMVRGEGAASQGVGLGLFIVREIARAHGGSVEAHSDAQAGTRFMLTLPIASAN